MRQGERGVHLELEHVVDVGQVQLHSLALVVGGFQLHGRGR